MNNVWQGLRARFSGRIGRVRFIAGIVSIFLGGPVLLLLSVLAIDALVPGMSDDLIALVVLALFGALVLMYSSLCVRRLRDLNWSPWWLPLVLVPFVNVVFNLLLCVVPGKTPVGTVVPVSTLASRGASTTYYILVALGGAFAWLLIIHTNTAPEPMAFNDDDTIALLEQLSPELQPVIELAPIDVFGVELPDLRDRIDARRGNQEIDDSRAVQPVTADGLYGVVVKIVCEDSDSYYFGSGTNIAATGLVLTNEHVVDVQNLRCFVGFPEPETGQIKEAYVAEVLEASGDAHDLALLSVTAPVVTQRGDAYGYEAKIINGQLPYYRSEGACVDKKTKLGAQATILGYPVLTGGALTITDGLVSSLYSQDGYLITSAKISSGNSGGMAVDESGCFIGVPTAVYLEDDEEQYGEIINTRFVNEYLEGVTSTIESTDAAKVPQAI